MAKKIVKDIIWLTIKSWSKILGYWDDKIDGNKIQNGLELEGRKRRLSLWLWLLHQYLKMRYVKWGNSWHYVSIEEIKFFLNGFSSYEIEAINFLSALGRNEKQRQFLVIIDELCFNKILLSNWKYITYGIAKK
jgi:hypothetical protein